MGGSVDSHARARHADQHADEHANLPTPPSSSGARLTQNSRTELALHSGGLGSCWGLTVIRPVMVMVPAGDEVS